MSVGVRPTIVDRETSGEAEAGTGLAKMARRAVLRWRGLRSRMFVR